MGNNIYAITVIALLIFVAMGSGFIVGTETDVDFEWHSGGPRTSAAGLPEIVNITSGSPTTGEQFSLRAKVTDDDGISNVTAEYWFGTGSVTNGPMSSLPSDEFSLWISIPANSIDTLHFIFHADDTLGNWNQSVQSTIPVLDNDDPVFGTDYSDTDPTTGDDFDLMAEITDNIGVDALSAEYWFGSGGHINTSLSNQGGNLWGGSIIISSDASTLRYRFRGSDSASNSAETSVVTLSVSDDDRPVFWEVSMIATAGTGEEINISVRVLDNIEIDSVSLDHWYGSGPHLNSTMDHGIGDIWYLNITVQENSLDDLNYIYHTEDMSGNHNYSGPYNTMVLDDDSPVLVNDTSDPNGTTGDPYDFEIICTDNIAVLNVTARYRFGFGEWFSSNLSHPADDNWTATIIIPLNASFDMEYHFSMVDGSGNTVNSSSRFVPMEDDDYPYVVEDSTYDNVSTGEWFSFSITLDDNVMIDTSYVEYWFGVGEHITEQMVGMCGGPHLFFFQIPMIATEDLNYRFIFNDTSNNTIITSVRTVDIWDDDLPEFGTDISAANATTGDEFIFAISVLDNIEVSIVTVEYGFQNGDYSNITLAMNSSGNWSGSVIIPLNSTDPLSYRYHANDSSGNHNTTDWYSRIVADNDPPVISLPSSVPFATTGDMYKFSVNVLDNINIDEVWLTYRIGDDDMKNISLAMGAGSSWIGQIQIGHTLDIIRFTVFSTDSSGNTALETSGQVMISDNDIPDLIHENSTRVAATGDDFVFRVEVNDNIGIAGVDLEYWIGMGDHQRVMMNGSSVHEALVSLPVNAMDVLRYKFMINDTSGNVLISQEYSLNITDNDPPVINSYVLDPQVAVIGGQILISLNSTDNIEIDTALLSYRFGSSDAINIQMTWDGMHYKTTVDIPDGTLTTLGIKFRVIDLNGNDISTDWIDVPSVDQTSPTIEPIDDVHIYLGESLNLTAVVSDNHGVSRVTWTGGTISSTGVNLDHIPDQVTDTMIVVTVTDLSGNDAFTSFRLVVLPLDHDGDGDGLPDLYEIEMGFSPDDPGDGDSDPDSDGVGNLDEYLNSTDPRDRDSDDDGMDDGWELRYGLDPINPDDDQDPDGDERSNLEEYNQGTDPTVMDTPDDGVDNEEGDYLILLILVLIFVVFTVAGLYFYFTDRTKREEDETEEGPDAEEDDSEYRAIGDDDDLDRDLEIIQEMKDMDIPDLEEESVIEDPVEPDGEAEDDIPELEVEDEPEVPSEEEELKDIDEMEEPELQL